MISIFPSWTFHLYVATKQQHLHMEYMYIKKAATLKVSDSTKISNMTGAIKGAGTAYPPGHMSSLLFYTTSTIFQNGINPPKTSFYFKNICLKMLWSKNFTNLQLIWNSVSIFSQHYLPKTWSFRLCFFLSQLTSAFIDLELHYIKGWNVGFIYCLYWVLWFTVLVKFKKWQRKLIEIAHEYTIEPVAP